MDKKIDTPCPKQFKDALLSGELAGMVNESVKGERISEPQVLYNVLSPLMAQHPNVEKFYCIFLDSKNRTISIDSLFNGSISACAVYPREIVKVCLDKGAASLIVAHNHPSGDTTPSNQDRNITKLILAACQVMGITLHEHVICGGGEFHSMACDGYISKTTQEIKDFF